MKAFYINVVNSRGLGGTIVSFSFRTHDIHVKSQSTLYRNLLLFSRYSGFLLQEYQQGGLGLAPNLPFHRILFPRASRPRASFLFSTSDRVNKANSWIFETVEIRFWSLNSGPIVIRYAHFWFCSILMTNISIDNKEQKIKIGVCLNKSQCVNVVA